MVWTRHVTMERRQPPVPPQFCDLMQRCIDVYWKLFASSKVSICSIFGAIQLLRRYCSTCASTRKFQRIGAACLWIAMKLSHGQDVPAGAALLSGEWNNVTPRRGSGQPHFQIRCHHLASAEVHVLKKLQYDVYTVTAHDMFVLLMRLHKRNNNDALFGKGVQILITMTLSQADVTYLPSQLAVAVALTCGCHVDGRWLVRQWEETFAWVQRFVDA